MWRRSQAILQIYRTSKAWPKYKDVVHTALVLDSLGEYAVLEEQNPNIEERDPKNLLQLGKLTETTNLLADELLLETFKLGYQDDDAMRKAIESLDSPWTALKLLRSDGYPNYRLPGRKPDVQLASVRCEVNMHARNLFQKWRDIIESANESGSPLRPGWPKFIVFKMLYNMLVAEVPPGIQAYNTLLHGFTQLGQHSLAQKSIISINYQICQLNPTKPKKNGRCST